MFKLALNPSGLFSHSNERKRTGKSESDFHKTDKVKYFITGSSDSDKIVRSFLPHKDQLKWRLFSREINENMGPASVMWNRIYLQNKERYFNVRSFFVSPCGTYLFLVAMHSSEKANTLKILDFNTQVVLKEFIIESLYGRFDDVPSNSIVMVPCDKGMIISSSHVKENTIFTWVSEAHVGKSLINLNQIKISQGTLSKTIRDFSSDVVLSSCGTKYLGRDTVLRNLYIVDPIKGLVDPRGSVVQIPDDTPPLPEVSSFATSRCEKKLVIAFYSGAIKVFNLETKIENYQISITESPTDFIIISPCGERFLIHLKNGVTKVFDLNTGDEIYELAEKENPIISVAITPCGKKWITGLTNGFVKIWDFMTGVELRQFRLHEDQMKSLQVSPCGKKIIVLTNQNEIQFWSIEEKDFDPDDPDFIRWKRAQNSDTGCFIQ